MLADWLLALAPILVVLTLMLGLRWRGTQAGPLGWLTALLIAALRFGAGWDVLFWAQVKALLLALWVLYIIWTALLFYRVTAEAGAVSAIGTGLHRLSAASAAPRLDVRLVPARGKRVWRPGGSDRAAAGGAGL